MLPKCSHSLVSALMSLTLVVCQVQSYTPIHRRAGSEGRSRGGVTGHKDDSSPDQSLQELVRGAQGARGSCQAGWLYTHHHCILDTGMEDGKEAEVFCSQQGALQARGICVKQSLASNAPLMDSSMGDDSKEDQGTQIPTSFSTESNYACPLGWAQFQNYCFFSPGSNPKTCGLLGASYLFNYCVTRVPHKLPVDFFQAIKRLDGSDYDLHRETRMCCCRGSFGLC